MFLGIVFVVVFINIYVVYVVYGFKYNEGSYGLFMEVYM